MGDRVAVVAVSQRVHEQRCEDNQRPQEMLSGVVMDMPRRTGLRTISLVRDKISRF